MNSYVNINDINPKGNAQDGLDEAEEAGPKDEDRSPDDEDSKPHKTRHKNRRWGILRQ